MEDRSKSKVEILDLKDLRSKGQKILCLFDAELARMKLWKDTSQEQIAVLVGAFIQLYGEAI
jgi:hypothetical protein